MSVARSSATLRDGARARKIRFAMFDVPFVAPTIVRSGRRVVARPNRVSLADRCTLSVSGSCPLGVRTSDSVAND
jgi:hypothetical protein